MDLAQCDAVLETKLPRPPNLCALASQPADPGVSTNFERQARTQKDDTDL
jgi:hypothetical protein